MPHDACRCRTARAVIAFDEFPSYHGHWRRRSDSELWDFLCHRFRFHDETITFILVLNDDIRIRFVRSFIYSHPSLATWTFAVYTTEYVMYDNTHDFIEGGPLVEGCFIGKSISNLVTANTCRKTMRYGNLSKHLWAETYLDIWHRKGTKNAPLEVGSDIEGSFFFGFYEAESTELSSLPTDFNFTYRQIWTAERLRRSAF